LQAAALNTMLLNGHHRLDRLDHYELIPRSF